ncbi:MAG: FAD:protein FMN transferase [Acidimicrobiales bacterium]
MGMAVSVDVRDHDVDPGALTDVFGWLRWVDETFSTYRPDSQVSRLGRGELSSDDCHDDVRTVLELCEDVCARTRGYFDARADNSRQLDPSGMVKGWAVERASAMLVDWGSTNHCINAGGDVRLRGQPEPGRAWQVGIVHPFDRTALTTVVAGTDLGVATSGTAERGLHVFDPHTGRPVAELASVTVVGPELTHADAYATAALAMGCDAPEWLAALPDHEAYLIDATGHVWWTPGFGSYAETARRPSPPAGRSDRRGHGDLAQAGGS